ncbi:MAG: thioredoxin family protein [Bacteroidales bacterium]|jgi:small redox-active disulfide protein 2|nr:thioredoxin family protein [Bacteroidales bacterium]
MSKEIKILGTGCPKCKQLEEAVRKTVAESGIDATISKVEDIVDIMGYGIMRTPGLVINGKVVMSGRLPSATELKDMVNS